ncbi:MFS transporter [Mycolicibacterium vaccae]|jgi:metabolite-proton symporter|uniref:Putative proline/betaine transporter n=1 Tax=Mycolicibacterium vaccae ATCC 25954 TaxID=1194972 RepID=K0UHE1_MYCVA|nr:MFS transporter [Mycolicibacterium vaccae]ANI41551.1 MFS transporter [Mycolicibacterium vaccae 95051]EJZ06667.1 shikimate transporter [Mycolicibacterium vaccae ATCC 25954]MCV7062791.1 MHS family MFS transporter [Mycolicibacterium vaccae]
MDTTAATADIGVSGAPNQARKAGIAALVGTTLEWYDFLIYGTAAALVLNSQFFPGADPTVGTLAAFATYAVGFLARPLGGIVLGNMGDRVGRKKMLVFTIVLMGVATTLIGLLPNYAAIGVWAPILLIVLRLLQGFGAGGEYAGAVVLSVEHGDQKRRGLAGAWAPAGFALATLLSTGVFQLATLLPEDAFQSWGWRVPFLLGSVLLIVGYFIRRNIDETQAYEKAVQAEASGVVEETKVPVLESIRRNPRNFLVVIGARMAENGFAYLFPVFAVGYAVNTLGVERSTTLLAVVIASAVQVVFIPIWAHVSDRVGRRPVYAGGALLSVLWLVPFFLVLESLNTALLIVGFVVGLGILYPAMLAPQAAYFAELFDTRTRLSGFAFAREIGSVLAGGFLPLIATALIAAFGHWWVIVVYLGILTALTLVALAFGPETNRKDIIETDPADARPAQAGSV